MLSAVGGGAWSLVGIGVVVVLAAIFVITTAVRRDRNRATGMVTRETASRDRRNPVLDDLEASAPAATGRALERRVSLEAHGGGGEVVKRPDTVPPAIREPLDDEALGVTRRQFLNRGVVGMFAFGLSGFGAAMLAFLWPTLSGGFGSKIKVSVGDLTADFAKKEPHYVPDGRLYIQPFPKEDVDKAKKITAYAPLIPGMTAGYVALYQKCVHLGCRVPWCGSSQWFECPCHGSKYNRVGEKKGGPAPRGLDRFVIVPSGDSLAIDTSKVIQGPPIGTNSTGQEQEGPHCA